MQDKTERLEGPGKFEPLSPEEEIISALCNDDQAGAARILREIENIGRVFLDALADMLDGDPKANPELLRLYPYRLELASWGNAGRKPKASRAKAKSNPNYKHKLPPRPTDAMLASKVRRSIEAGSNRAQAISAVAQSCKLSKSTVEKAYDTQSHRIHVRTKTR